MRARGAPIDYFQQQQQQGNTLSQHPVIAGAM